MFLQSLEKSDKLLPQGFNKGMLSECRTKLVHRSFSRNTVQHRPPPRPSHHGSYYRPRYHVTAASPAMSGSPTSAFHFVSTVAAADRSAPEKTILDSWDNFASAETSFQTLFKWTRAAWPERPWTRISVATQWSRTMVLTRDLCSGVSCIGAAASSGTDCLPFKRLRFISAGHIAQWRPTKHRQTACMSRIRSNNKNDTRGSKDREVHPPRLLQQSADSTAAMIWNRWNRDTWISKNPTRNGAGTLSDLPPRGKHGDQEQPGTRGWENCTRIRGFLRNVGGR